MVNLTKFIILVNNGDWSQNSVTLQDPVERQKKTEQSEKAIHYVSLKSEVKLIVVNCPIPASATSLPGSSRNYTRRRRMYEKWGIIKHRRGLPWLLYRNKVEKDKIPCSRP